MSAASVMRNKYSAYKHMRLSKRGKSVFKALLGVMPFIVAFNLYGSSGKSENCSEFDCHPKNIVQAAWKVKSQIDLIGKDNLSRGFQSLFACVNAVDRPCGEEGCILNKRSSGEWKDLGTYFWLNESNVLSRFALGVNACPTFFKCHIGEFDEMIGLCFEKREPWFYFLVFANQKLADEFARYGADDIKRAFGFEATIMRLGCRLVLCDIGQNVIPVNGWKSNPLITNYNIMYTVQTPEMERAAKREQRNVRIALCVTGFLCILAIIELICYKREKLGGVCAKQSSIATGEKKGR